MPHRHERVLTRTYALLAAASVLPLLIVILILALFQFRAERQRLFEELEEQAVKHDILLANTVRTVQDYVRTLSAWGAVYWTESDPARPLPIAAAGTRTLADGGLLIQGGGFARRPNAGAEARLAENLARHMRLSHQATPYLRWSYYLSGQTDLVGVVPFADGEGFGGELRDASPEQILERFRGHALLGRVRNGGEGGADGWTEAYFDPAGAGWVVAYGAPIRAGERLVGVVGASVLLDFLTSFLRAFDYPAGRLWLVDERLQVLATSEGRNAVDPRLPRLGEVLPPAAGGLDPAELMQPSASFRDLGAVQVLAQRVGTTPWTLLYVVSPAELTAVILPRLVPYGIILIGLVLTLLLAHAFRERLIVRPALAFADYIKAEADRRSPRPPGLPALWQPLVRAAAEAFGAQRSSLAELKDSEAMKSAMIASAFDALIAIDEGGLIVEFNPSAEQLFGHARAAVLGQPMAELIIPAHLRTRHLDGFRRCLASGPASIEGRRVEMEALRADGSLFPIELAVTEVRQADRRLFAAYLRDITERRAMERSLRESEQHFRTIAESHPVPVAIARLEDRRILHASEAFARLVGLPLEQIVGGDNQRFYVDIKDRAELIRRLREQGSIEGFELASRRADGSVFPAALSSRLIEFQGAPAIVSAIVDLSSRSARRRRSRASGRRCIRARS